MEFKFEGRVKLLTQVLMVVGLIALVGGYLTDYSHGHQRWWANLLVNGFFYFSISVAALFFYALQYATESAWSVVLKRFFEAMWGFLPYGAAVIVIVIAAGQFHVHHLYHWMDATLYDPTHGNYDAIIANKAAYFYNPMMWK